MAKPRQAIPPLSRADVVVVALSGGVDSFMAAATIQAQGVEVVACHLVLNDNPSARAAARTAAGLLGLDLYYLDLSADFERLVVEPFVRTYAQGQTPNPCVACNPAIKFGRLWEWAKGQGATRIATGHYAGLVQPLGSSSPVLVRPKDRRKDQTYFLCRLPGEVLAGTIFALTDLTKDEVKVRAARLGRPPGPESQEICFLAGTDYRDFLDDRLGDSLMIPGDFVDVDGRVLGRHRGLAWYTVGQRRGLNLPGPKPLYVLALDPDHGRVIVGAKSETMTSRFTVRDPVWSLTPAEPEFTAFVQIRSRHIPARATVKLLADGRVEVIFDRPQPSVAPGQAAAFYKDVMMIGGGWIEDHLPISYISPLGSV